MYISTCIDVLQKAYEILSLFVPSGALHTAIDCWSRRMRGSILLFVSCPLWLTEQASDHYCHVWPPPASAANSPSGTWQWHDATCQLSPESWHLCLRWPLNAHTRAEKDLGVFCSVAPYQDHSTICLYDSRLLQSMMVALVLSRLDYGSTVLAGLPKRLLDRLQSVQNASARHSVCCTP